MYKLKNLSSAAVACGVTSLALAQTPNRPGPGSVNDGPGGGSNLTLYIVVAVVVIAAVAFFALRGKKK